MMMLSLMCILMWIASLLVASLGVNDYDVNYKIFIVGLVRGSLL